MMMQREPETAPRTFYFFALALSALLIVGFQNCSGGGGSDGGNSGQSIPAAPANISGTVWRGTCCGSGATLYFESNNSFMVLRELQMLLKVGYVVRIVFVDVVSEERADLFS